MLKVLSRLTMMSFVLSLLLAVWPAGPISHAQTNEQCFEQTGFCISGPILNFWQRNGGLPVFGYPLSPQQATYVGLLTPSQVPGFVPGVMVQAQQFERNRLELHPDGSVKVGRLGADVLSQQGRDWFNFPKSAPQPGCEFFEATGHNICGEMLRAWRASGGMELIGMPLSDPFEEMIEDGKVYTIQWFERARFQITPGVGVQLGRLGALDLCASIPPPVNAAISPSNCLIRGVDVSVRITGFPPNTPVRIWAVLDGGFVLPPEEFDDFIFTPDETGGMILPLGAIPRELGNRLYFVFQGQDDTRAITYFNVIDPERTPSLTSTFHPCYNLPPPANGAAAPINENRDVIGDPTTCATPGIDFLGVLTGGFSAGEPVVLTVTAPDGQPSGRSELITDARGLALTNEGLLPRFQVNQFRNRPGLYIFFFLGQWSNHVAVVPIMVSNVPLPALPPLPASARLTIVNESQEDICIVNFSFITEDTWGPDRLDPNETIPPGNMRSFDIPPGEYDIRLLDCSGNELLDQRNVPIFDSYELRFRGRGTAGIHNRTAAMSTKRASAITTQK